MYELDRRRQLHHIGIDECRQHQPGGKLLPTSTASRLEWTFVRHKRRSRNGPTGTMQRPLLPYGLLRIP